MVGTLATSADVRQLQQLFQVLEQPVRIPARIVAHHEVAERIDHEQRMLAPRGGKLAQQRRAGRARRVQDLEAGLLAPEELAGTAPGAGEEHPLQARHVVVEREARLAHHPKGLAAGAVAGACRQALWVMRSEEHTSELQSLAYLVCRLLLEKKKNTPYGHD